MTTGFLRWNRLLALALVFMMAVGTLAAWPPQAVSAEKQTKLTIHYKPAENNTKDWNLWIWPEGKEGRAYPFNTEDSFGQVATVELSGDYEKVGFIVRTDDWDKDIAEDRFIEDIVGGEAEIWLISGDPAIYTAPPDGSGEKKSFDQVKLTIHYYRYDGQYDGWNLWIWPDGKDGQAYAFTGQDAFGKIAKMTVANMKDVYKIGFIMRYSESGNDWADREFGDRFITKINDDGTAEIWLAQNQERVFYKESQVDRSPRIISSSLDEINIITLETNIPFQTNGTLDEGFIVKSGSQTAKIASVKLLDKDDKGYARKAELHTEQELDLNLKYTVGREGYEEAAVSMGDIYGSKSFEDIFAYEGGDLGAVYTDKETKFRVWAPTATEAKLVTFNKWDQANGAELDMTKAEKGTWTAVLNGNQNGLFYKYKVKVNGSWNEAVDPYARAVSVNGDKGVVVDLAHTNPEGWDEQERPPLQNYVDAIIYELHVRDLSMHPQSGIKNKGKFLGLTEAGTTGPGGTKTGLDHIKDLGVTHVQLLPIFDYNSVDETKLDHPQFNWGYDPKNYNAPEGSYATDPYNPAVRITELKQAVQALHSNGLRVIMDVVYNHMFSADPSNLGKLVPGYYYRYTSNGKLANGTGVGNDTASERAMMRKLIVDSVKYWVQEYKVDGFRFDLMGIHDVETMNLVRAELDKIDRSIIVIGEGWDMGTPLKAELKANQKNAFDMPRIAHFNDYIRDGLKGSVFDAKDAGFVNGDFKKFSRVMGGITGGIKYNTLVGQFAYEPDQAVTYVEAHDNNTLWDKLLLTNPGDSEEDRIKMHKLASTIVLTSQGIPFIHAGQEFLRTKGGDHNSYKSPDAVNQLDWERKAKYQHVVDYYKGVIALRKEHPAFRLTSSADIKKHLKFIDTESGVIAFTLGEFAGGDRWQTIAVAHNAHREAKQVKLPAAGTWNVVLNGDKAGTAIIESITGDTVAVPALTSMVLYSGEKKEAVDLEAGSEVDTKAVDQKAGGEGGSGSGSTAVAILIIAVLFFAGLVSWYYLKKRRKA
jgi:pullulanase